MKIAIPLYEGFTALDCIGPYDLLSRMPGAELAFVAREAGPVKADTGMLSILAERCLADTEAPDIVLVPGGFGSGDAAKDPVLLDWLRRAHETTKWTTSVCTGSEILAAAGLLKGLDAATHWAATDRLVAHGANPTGERVVFRGKIVTAAGVSAGIDMALALVAREHGDDFAKALQLAIEYDPDPPFDSGSPAKADPAVIALVRASFAG